MRYFDSQVIWAVVCDGPIIDVFVDKLKVSAFIDTKNSRERRKISVCFVGKAYFDDCVVNLILGYFVRGVGNWKSSMAINYCI